MAGLVGSHSSRNLHMFYVWTSRDTCSGSSRSSSACRNRIVCNQMIVEPGQHAIPSGAGGGSAGGGAVDSIESKGGRSKSPGAVEVKLYRSRLNSIINSVISAEIQGCRTGVNCDATRLQQDRNGETAVHCGSLCWGSHHAGECDQSGSEIGLFHESSSWK
ncbi:MAG: hypothetical protein JWR74_1061 [Polaromonas sp.]|nr:hypothetical protein [Polaromonas sp.]